MTITMSFKLFYNNNPLCFSYKKSCISLHDHMKFYTTVLGSLETCESFTYIWNFCFSMSAKQLRYANLSKSSIYRHIQNGKRRRLHCEFIDDHNDDDSLIHDDNQYQEFPHINAEIDGDFFLYIFYCIINSEILFSIEKWKGWAPRWSGRIAVTPSVICGLNLFYGIFWCDKLSSQIGKWSNYVIIYI